MIPANDANDRSQARFIMYSGLIVKVNAITIKMSRHGAIFLPTYQANKLSIVMTPARMIDGVHPTMLIKNKMNSIENSSPAKREILPNTFFATSTRTER
jgi:hypothetical protein